MKATEKVLRVLEYLRGAFPGFRPDASTAAAWSDALDGYSAEQLVEAARKVARHHTYGAPSVANVVEAIEGTVRKFPEYATDNFNARILTSVGAPIIERWREERVPYGTPLDRAGESAAELSGGPQLLSPEGDQ